MTNAQGDFHFPGLGPGMYKVVAVAPGFATETVDNIDLNAMSIRQVAVQLQPSTVTTSVEVSASTLAVDTDEAKISTVIDAKQSRNCRFRGGMCTRWRIRPRESRGRV